MTWKQYNKLITIWWIILIVLFLIWANYALTLYSECGPGLAACYGSKERALWTLVGLK